VSGPVWNSCGLVFRGGRGKCAENCLRINKIRPELVFRGPDEECAHNSNEISAFRPELVFREVPGKWPQRGGQPQRFRRRLPRAALLDPVADGVVRVPGTPAGLGLLPPRRLALRLAARVLTASDTGIGPEPPAADRAGSLPGLRHGDSSSPCCSQRPTSFSYSLPGSFLVSRGGSILASAEAGSVPDVELPLDHPLSGPCG